MRIIHSLIAHRSKHSFGWGNMFASTRCDVWQMSGTVFMFTRRNRVEIINRNQRKNEQTGDWQVRAGDAFNHLNWATGSMHFCIYARTHRTMWVSVWCVCTHIDRSSNRFLDARAIVRPPAFIPNISQYSYFCGSLLVSAWPNANRPATAAGWSRTLAYTMRRTCSYLLVLISTPITDTCFRLKSYTLSQRIVITVIRWDIMRWARAQVARGGRQFPFVHMNNDKICIYFHFLT